MNKNRLTMVLLSLAMRKQAPRTTVADNVAVLLGSSLAQEATIVATGVALLLGFVVWTPGFGHHGLRRAQSPDPRYATNPMSMAALLRVAQAIDNANFVADHGCHNNWQREEAKAENPKPWIQNKTPNKGNRKY